MIYKKIALVVAFICGFFMLLQHFIENEIVKNLYQTLLNYYAIIFAVTLVIGGLGVLKYHLKPIIKWRKNSFYSLVTVAAIFFMVISAIIEGTSEGTLYYWAFHNMQAPMQATIFSLLAFFVASAAYRGFRIKSKTAVILAISTFAVLLGKSVLGEMISPYIPDFANWILNNPSVAAKRGILVGIGLGSIATALRVILGVERSYL